MIEITGTAKSSAQMIWDTCFKPMKWETWDIDIKGMQDVSGGCESGTTFKFHMNDDKMLPIVLSDVEEPKSLTFSGKFLGGAIGVKGTILLEESPEQTTKIAYTFGLTGILGAMAGAAGSKQIAQGTQAGLDNIIRLSEQASGTAKPNHTK